MVFLKDEIIVTQSVDRAGMFFVLRPNGPDVVFEIWTDGTFRTLSGIMSDLEYEFIKSRIVTEFRK